MHRTYFLNQDIIVDFTIKGTSLKGKCCIDGIWQEEKTVTYKVKISPPNMYDMFSAQEFGRTNHSHSYWLLNSTSSTNRYCGVITDIGVPLNESIGQYDVYGVRAVAYIRKGTVISNGSGTYESSYKLK